MLAKTFVLDYYVGKKFLMNYHVSKEFSHELSCVSHAH
jgi:hypothetical protein